MGVDFKPATEEEVTRLRRALDANALKGEAMRMQPGDTSFVLDEAQVTEDLINAIQSVPCHY